MYDVSQDKGRTSDTSREITAVRDPGVEMGAYHHGSDHQVATDDQGLRCNFGSGGPIDEERTLYSYSVELISREIG